MNDDSVEIMSIFQTPYNTSFKNKIVPVIAVKPPLVKGHYVKHKASEGSPLPYAELIEDEQGGLLASLKTFRGTVEVKFRCTSEYWTEFKSSNLWKYHDDNILLKFNDEGEVYGHILQVGDDSEDSIYGTVVERGTGRTLRAADALKANQDAVAREVTGNTLIVEKSKDNTFTAKVVPSSYKPAEVDVILSGISETFKSNGDSIDKMDIVADNYIVADIRGDKYIHITHI